MLLDLHIVHALANGWVPYRDNLAAFSELFPGVSAAMLSDWHAALVAETPVFRAAFAAGTPEGYPLISVELMSETPSDRYMSKSRGIVDGRQILGFSARQVAEVTIQSKRDEVTRALSRVVQAVMLRATSSFLRSGYVEIQYDGSGEMGLDELLIAEDLGIHTRRLTYAAVVDLEVPEQLPGDLVGSTSWYVQIDDVPEDLARAPAVGAGVPGGVTPVED